MYVVQASQTSPLNLKEMAFWHKGRSDMADQFGREVVSVAKVWTVVFHCFWIGGECKCKLTALE